MKTKELKDNKTLRTGVIFAAIAIITLIAIIMTFAKYASQGTGEDSARIAKWGLDSNIPTDLELFDAQYKGIGAHASENTVESKDGSDVIAPGTSKERDITLATFTNNEAPEVMYHFEPSIEIEDSYVEGQSLIAQLDVLPGWYWTFGTNGDASQKYKTVADLKTAVEATQQTDIAPNTMPETSSIQLGWIWSFESGYDANDTNLGNLIAQGQLSGMKVTLNLNAYQCQGCTGPTPSKYKSIQSTLNFSSTNTSQTVNFLPAYKFSECPCKFYIKNGDNYDEITGITTMADLGSKIKAAGPENVYTDDTASGLTFYGTIDQRWYEAGQASTFSGYNSSTYLANGLDQSFKQTLNNAGLKTVYFTNNDDNEPTSKGNWNTTSTRNQPYLFDKNDAEVYIADFVRAYGNAGIIASGWQYVWGPHVLHKTDKDLAYFWADSDQVWHEWRMNDYENSVILTRVF